MILPDSFSLFSQALGWAVAHSLWQITLIWLLFKAVTWRLQGHNNAVYLLSIAAMAAGAIWAAVTFGAEYERVLRQNAVVQMAAHAPNDATGLQITTGQALDQSNLQFIQIVQQWLEGHAQQIGWLWFLCATVLWLRLLGGYWLSQRLRHCDTSPVDTNFQNICDMWAERLGIVPKIIFKESKRIAEPLTIGFWKPVILFPVGLLAGLTPSQTEALLLHELAHIRRFDYLVNLFQLSLEVVFFYHPLFWLLSREARSRREFCCDDVVLHYTADPLLYARTLTDLQLSFVHAQNQFTMNAIGKSNFTERILRIAGITPNRPMRSNWVMLLLLPLLVGLSSWWPAAHAKADAGVSRSIVSNDNRAVSDLIRTDSVSPKRNRPESSVTVPAAPGPVTPATSGVEPPAATSGLVAVQAEKMNVLYIGVENPVCIGADGVPVEDLSLRLVGNGTVKGGMGKYSISVTTPGEVTIQVYRSLNGKESLFNEVKYRVKRIPDPTPYMAGKKGQAITKEVLLQATGVDAILENFDFDAYCEVMGYEVTIVQPGIDAVAYIVTGRQFSDKVLDLFRQAENGSGIYIDDIRVKCPGDAAVRHIGGIAFKIKAAE